MSNLKDLLLVLFKEANMLLDVLLSVNRIDLLQLGKVAPLLTDPSPHHRPC